MAVLESIPVPPVSALSSASFFVLDGNAPVASAAKALENAERCAGCRVLFEPTSEPKGARFAAAGLLKHVDYCTPNRGELLAMASAVGLSTAVKDGEEGVRETATNLRGKMKVGAALIVGMGKDGVMVVDGNGSRKIKAAEGVQVLNATGAGDTQTGGLVHAMLQGHGLDKSVQFGMACAVESLQCEEKAISPTLHKLIGSLR
jgi:sugar/nucleoside kinase (ribokinase family)